MEAQRPCAASAEPETPRRRRHHPAGAMALIAPLATQQVEDGADTAIRSGRWERCAADCPVSSAAVETASDDRHGRRDRAAATTAGGAGGTKATKLAAITRMVRTLMKATRRRSGADQHGIEAGAFGGADDQQPDDEGRDDDGGNPAADLQRRHPGPGVTVAPNDHLGHQGVIADDGEVLSQPARAPRGSWVIRRRQRWHCLAPVGDQASFNHPGHQLADRRRYGAGRPATSTINQFGTAQRGHEARGQSRSDDEEATMPGPAFCAASAVRTKIPVPSAPSTSRDASWKGPTAVQAFFAVAEWRPAAMRSNSAGRPNGCAAAASTMPLLRPLTSA